MNSVKTSYFRKKITDCFYLALALVIVMLQVACKKNAETIGTGQLVLEGYLYQGEKVDSIHFTSSLSFESLDTVYPAVLGAQASIIWNGKSYALQSIGGGYYNCADSNLLVIVCFFRMFVKQGQNRILKLWFVKRFNQFGNFRFFLFGHLAIFKI